VPLSANGVWLVPHLGDGEFIPDTGYSSDIHRLATTGWLLCSRKTLAQKPHHEFVGSIKWVSAHMPRESWAGWSGGCAPDIRRTRCSAGISLCARCTALILRLLASFGSAKHVQAQASFSEPDQSTTMARSPHWPGPFACPSCLRRSPVSDVAVRQRPTSPVLSIYLRQQFELNFAARLSLW